MTKEQLARLGIVIDKDEVSDEEGMQLIEQHTTGLVNEKTKLKGQVDKYSTEIANYKKKETDRLSEEEKTKLHYAELEKENADLRKAKALTERETAYISAGYDPKLAKEIAEAELEGKPTAELHKKHITAVEERVKAEVLKGTPDPKTKSNPKTWTKEEFAKASYEEKLALYNDNPQLYAELTK